MKAHILKTHSWLLGAFAAIALVTTAGATALADGLSFKTGDVEMKVQVSAKSGLALHFIHEDR